MPRKKQVVWNLPQGAAGSPPAIRQSRPRPKIPYASPVSDVAIETHNMQSGARSGESSMEGARPGDLFRLENDFAVAQKLSNAQSDPIHPYIVSKHFIWSQTIIPQDTTAVYLGECRVEEQTKNGKMRILRHRFLIGESIYIIQDLARIEKIQV